MQTIYYASLGQPDCFSAAVMHAPAFADKRKRGKVASWQRATKSRVCFSITLYDASIKHTKNGVRLKYSAQLAS